MRASVFDQCEVAMLLSRDYIPYAEMAVLGLKHYCSGEPVIYCLDTAALEFAERHDLTHRPISVHRFPHVSKLYILRQSSKPFQLVVDADCWLLSNSIIQTLVVQCNQEDIAAVGHVGQLDLPYLFRGSSQEDILSRLKELYSIYPTFVTDWLAKPLVDDPVQNINAGVVVDIPMLYGGLAIYNVELFSSLSILEWAHSADQVIAIHAYENGLSMRSIGDYQFNRVIEESRGAVHFAGPKPSDTEFEAYKRDYLNYLKSDCTAPELGK